MKIGFVVNYVQTEKRGFTTVRLARKACNRGHEVHFIGLGDFTYQRDGTITARASSSSAGDFPDDCSFLEHIQHVEPGTIRLVPGELDVLLLRSDPADEVHTRPWAPSSGLLFAQLVARAGVIVLNDPRHLTDASNKTYFQTYPERIRPRTCITMDREEMKRFIHEEDGAAVIKPLQGSGGRGVFILKGDSAPNINQIIDATLREGYAIVQEYLPQAADGDLRLLTLNGRPLVVDGVYACIRRHSQNGDGRSNVSAGGRCEVCPPDEDALQLAEIAGPKLIRDGMYFAGLDIVGDKMMEINVDTPGGLTAMEDLTGKDFSKAILMDLEKKVLLRDHYRGRVESVPFAMS